MQIHTHREHLCARHARTLTDAPPEDLPFIFSLRDILWAQSHFAGECVHHSRPLFPTQNREGNNRISQENLIANRLYGATKEIGDDDENMGAKRI